MDSSPPRNMFYPPQPDVNAKGNFISWYNGVRYPFLHLHSSAELITVIRGTFTLTVNGKTEELHSNQCALILPYQLHSFTCSEDAFYWVHVFSTNTVPSFFKQLGKLTGEKAAFECSRESLDYYRLRCLISPQNSDNPNQKRDTMRVKLHPLIIKSALYGVLADYLSSAKLIETDHTKEALIAQIMVYIFEHYQEDISLESVASHFGYEPHYFSRYMRKFINIPFRTIVNHNRINTACQLLTTTDLSISEIATNVGYGCLRTFNRVFLEMEGVTPRDYREAHATASTS